MSNFVSFNPMLTTNAAGSFSVQSEGYVQGTALDDPAVRYQLVNGVLAATESYPMWGGVALSENMPSPGFGNVTGSTVGRAALTANISGFSVFNQGHAMLNWPQNKVPIVGQGGTVPFYRMGSNARIPVQCDPALATLQGGAINQQVSWDLVNQKLIPYAPAEAANVITAMSWAATNGGTVTATTTTAHGYVPGNWVTISGVVPTAYNGDVQLLAGTTGSTLVYALPAASTPGTVTTQGQVNAGGGALPVKVLEVNIGNSKVVTWDSVLLTANWTLTGATALILI